MNTRRLVIIGLFVAIAGVLHVVESWLPMPVPVPGAKLGLANIVSLLALTLFGWKDAMLVAVLRVLLGSLLGGALLGPSFAMSLGGALASVIAMAISAVLWSKAFSLVGISVIGSTAHNLAQITIAAVLVSSAGLYLYLPYLVLFALPTGIATGLTARFLLAKMPEYR